MGNKETGIGCFGIVAIIYGSCVTGQYFQYDDKNVRSKISSVESDTSSIIAKVNAVETRVYDIEKRGYNIEVKVDGITSTINNIASCEGTKLKLHVQNVRGGPKPEKFYIINGKKKLMLKWMVCL